MIQIGDNRIPCVSYKPYCAFSRPADPQIQLSFRFLLPQIIFLATVGGPVKPEIDKVDRNETIATLDADH